jgi:hypothetical protein
LLLPVKNLVLNCNHFRGLESQQVVAVVDREDERLFGDPANF